MKPGLDLHYLLTEVMWQQDKRRDFVANTKESIQMVEASDMPSKVAIVLLKEGASELERFSITENCHRQIAGRLGIPWKYYDRLLADHRDLVINQVNALFEREPQTRLLRTLDGKARAFLSDRYRAIDNDEVIAKALPPIVRGEIPSKLLSSNVTENHMYIKVLFTGDNLVQDIGTLRNGSPDTVRPGCIIKNSETGHGSLDIDAFFWRSCCDNGCVFGSENIFSYKRRHMIFTDETKHKQNERIFAEVTDAMQALAKADNARRMGDALRATKNGTQVKDAFAAVSQLAIEVPLMETEKNAVIANLLTDGDFSRWGMLNAVTKVANTDDVDYERACELENIGGQLIEMGMRQWDRIALAKTE